MRIRTLIVDDEPLARERLRTLLEQEPSVLLVGECSNGLEAVEQIRKQKPDLVFLDIQMPELDGFGVVNALAPESLPAIVFVTAYDRFALRAFEVHALDYLLKPFDRDRFQKTLARAVQQIQQHPTADLPQRLTAFLGEWKQETKPLNRLAVKTEGRVILLKVEEIDWIEAADNYVHIHRGAEDHLIRDTLTSLESKLPPEKFLRISRSIIVNLDRVRELQPMFHGDYAVILNNGARLTLSRNYRDKLNQILGKGL
jgi:two-component system, LytTR family, response regulator